MTSTIDPPAGEPGESFDGESHAVRRRELLPTAREIRNGAVVAEHDFVETHAAEERPTVRERISTTAKMANPRNIEGSRRALFIVGALGAIGAWDVIAIGVIYPEMRSDFTFNLGFLAFVQTAATGVAQVLGPLIGWAADRFKRVWMLRVGVLLLHGSTVILGLAGSFGGFMLSRLVYIGGNAIQLPSQAALTADYFPPSSRFRAFSFFGATAALGAFIGPLLVGVTATYVPWRPTVLLFGVLAVGVSLLTFFLREPLRGYWDRVEAGATTDDAAMATPADAPTIVESFRIGWGIQTLRRLWLASMFIGAWLFAQIFVFGYLASEGFGPFARSVVIASGGLVTLIFLPFAGAIADGLSVTSPGRTMTLLGGVFIVQGAAYAGIAMSPSVYVSIILILVASTAYGFFFPLAQALTSLIIPPNMRGIGLQFGSWFALPGVAVIFGFIKVSSIFAFLAHSGVQAQILGPALPLLVGGYILSSGAKSVGRDIKSARAVALAGDEAEQARLRGRNKMLICRDLEVSYDSVQVLFGVDFDVEEGELVALLGTNGAGKSTLMRAICGIQRAGSGAIFLDGIDITQEPAHANATRGIVMVPGGHAIFPTLTVAENLRTAAWIHQADETHVTERTEEVLELFPVLRDRLHEQAGNMSGGEQQMLAIGQAFLMKPRLLMIDELSLGLAPAIVEKLLDTIRRIHAAGTTIILIEQSINVAVTIAERAVFMEKGEVRFDGPTTELMRRPELIRAVFMGGATTGGPLSRTASRVREETKEQLLAVNDVSVSFGGVKALDHATLTVEPEEIVGIIGPNGAGKTTLFDVISGFLTPNEGAVMLGGADVTALAPDGRAKLGLGRSFQSAKLFPSLTVRENIAVAMERVVKVRSPLLTALWTPRVRSDERHIGRRVDGLIDILGLGAFADKFVNELSTGTRRSVDIACIMASAPKMLLLDEPSSGLAQAETEALGPVLERVARDAGCGMLVIEHDIGLVSSISHRLYAMELGTVVTSGPPEEVVRDPRVLSSYLAATEDVLVRSDLNRLMLDADAEPTPAEPTTARPTTKQEKRNGHVRQ